MADDNAPRPLPGRRRSERGRDVAVIAIGAMGVFAILALSGSLGWVEALTACIVMLAGTMAYFVGSAVPEDEHALAQAIEALAAEPAGSFDAEAIVEALPFPALHIDPDGRVDAANERSRPVFRVRGEQRMLASAVIRNPVVLAAVERTLAEGRADRVEMATGGAGEEIWLAHLAPLGMTGGVLVVLEDRTAIRRAERARADFLANASHELRTPLTSLAGFIETMRGPARNDKESWDRFLEIMSDQTERMRRLIADLLSLSRIEFREHKPPASRQDLAPLFQKTVLALRPVAAERDISVAFDGPDSDLVAVADRDEMIQVAQNLLANAVKYSHAGGQITVSCGRAASLDAASRLAGWQWDEASRMTIQAPPRDQSGPAVWLRVSDDGPGIEREHLPRLGQRFYRVDESRGGEVTGTGLGLAIVKHIMSRHRGGFIVESRPGKGAAFGIWCAAAERAAPLTPTAPHDQISA